MRPMILLLTALALGACKPAVEPPKEVAAAPPTAPKPETSRFTGDFNALGTEPFWAVEVRAGRLKLSRPDAADLVVSNPGPRVEGSKAVWPVQGLVLTLTEGQCSDGMSDRTYPWFAEVTTTDSVLKGCAARPEALTDAN